MKEQLRLKGHIKSFITRENGDVEQLMDKHNTIHADIRQKIIDAFQTETGTGFAFDNMFTANTTPPSTGKDGIWLTTGTTNYSAISSIAEVSSTSVKITGTFTGTAVTFTGAQLGRDIHSIGGIFNFVVAEPSSWTSAVLGASDTLTVEWTLSI